MNALFTQPLTNGALATIVLLIILGLIEVKARKRARLFFLMHFMFGEGSGKASTIEYTKDTNDQKKGDE